MSARVIQDVRGLAVSAPDAAAMQRLDTLIDELYYYRPGFGDRLDELLNDYPDFTLARILKGYSLFSEGTADVFPRVREQLLALEALPANPRERLHQEALRAWLADDLTRRALAFEQILLEWPLDLLALRQHTGALFWSGEKRYQAEVSASVARHWGSQTPGYGHFLSAHAFAMEEIGLYELAERTARAALAIQPQDLWALHGLSHVLEMQGRSDEGIELLNGAATFLNDYNLFRGHLWWHLSLFNLSLGRLDAALELFDRQIYPKSSTFYLDVQNGASLLARLEFQGMDVGGDRWRRLAEASVINGPQNTIWFTSLHHVMALIRGGQDGKEQATLDYLQGCATTSRQADLAHRLSLAAASYYRGNPADSLQQLLALRQYRGELGASHAQQDLYDQIAVTAALALDDLPRVRQLLKARRGTRVFDTQTSLAFEEHASRIDTLADPAAVRREMRWESQGPD